MSIEKMKIEDLGWGEFFEAGKRELGMDDFSVARVVAQHKGSYKVKNSKGEFLAKVKGRQMFEAKDREDYPAVGDWVAIMELDGDGARIEAVLPRKSIIKRRSGDKNRTGDKNDVQIIATNIDVAFVVQSVGRDYSLNRFERYLAILRDAGIEPVIIINKADLISEAELEEKLREIRIRLDDVDVIATSIVSGEGVDRLKRNVEKGNTYCFLGSSGVGKSSLINKLLGEEAIKTEEIGSYSDRGKHKTTSREMYFLENGGIVIDNPGVREIGMTDVEEGVDSLFGDIAQLAERCKYADCTHVHEPGCAVLAALEKRELDEEQYFNYINLKKETRHYSMSKFEKKEKGRNFGKFIKNAKKDFKRFGHKDY